MQSFRDAMNRADEPTRRHIVKTMAAGCLGVTFLESLSNHSANAAPSSRKKANAVIYISLDGGMSHLDTFDPKPGKAEMGKTSVIRAANGEQFGNGLPEMAKAAREFAIIRSMNSKEGSHSRATYLIKKSYPVLPGVSHPSMGGWAVKLAGERNAEIPNYVIIGSNGRRGDAGFMGSRYMPTFLGDPNRGIANVRRGVSPDDFNQTLGLIDKIDSGFRARYTSNAVDSYNEFYDRALKLMASKDLSAFDLTKEPANVRNSFGRSRFGQGLVLARRLVQAGARFVEVADNGWDMHNNIADRLDAKLPNVDTGVAALLADLKSHGLLDTTLVALVTEFGRKPQLDSSGGRGHWPKAWSTLLAGAGVRGGAVYGKTDARGAAPVDNPVSPQDFNATIARAMGIEPDKMIYDPNTGRPFRMGGIAGKPIEALF